MPRLAASLLLVAALSGCGAEPQRDRTEPAAGPTPSIAPSRTPTTSPSATGSRLRLVRGVDASHHQGSIDWERVRRDRVEFAYLKASEGSTFVDPRFVSNARAARAAGLRVGGYHYFSTCSPGAPQAAHFLGVLRSAGAADTMPPAVDLELQGNCSAPPPREQLLDEVRAFLAIVERRTGQRMVVYAYPDFEARYRFSPALDRRQWVRRIGDTPPDREWWIWQRDDRASIDGFAAPADLNVMRGRR